MFTLVQQLNTIRNAKAKLRAEQATRKRAAYEKKKAKLDAMSAAHSKTERQKRYRAQGQEEARKKAKRGQDQSRD